MKKCPTKRSETALRLLITRTDICVDDVPLEELINDMDNVSINELGLLRALEGIFLDSKNWNMHGFNGRGESCVRSSAQFRGLQYRP